MIWVKIDSFQPTFKVAIDLLFAGACIINMQTGEWVDSFTLIIFQRGDLLCHKKL